jgi:hypothetical protein
LAARNESSHPARQFRHSRKSVTLQQTRCDRRSIAAGAHNDDRPVARNLCHTIEEPVQWHIDAAVDVRVLPFSGGAHVDEMRRIGRAEPLADGSRGGLRCVGQQIVATIDRVHPSCKMSRDIVEANAVEPSVAS